MPTPRKKAEPFPTSVDLPAGAWRVVRGDPAPGDTSPLLTWGRCDYESRTIFIRPKIARALAHLTLEHEIVHAILFDAGVKLSESKEEAVADAIALARVHAMGRP